MTLRARAVSTCAALALLAGCAALGTKEPATETLGSTELLSRLMQHNAALESLRSLARISYQAGEEKGGFQGAVVVDRPDRFRLEAFSLFGTALVVTVDGDRVTGFYPRENRFYRGRSSKENLFRYTQVLLDLDELTALLLGVPPVVADVRWEVTHGIAQRRLPDGSLDMVELHGATGAPVRWERFDRRGTLQFTAVFQEFADTSAGPFPLKISFAVPALDRRVEIRYDEPEINVKLSDSLFVQNLPETAVEVPLEALGG